MANTIALTRALRYRLLKVIEFPTRSITKTTMLAMSTGSNHAYLWRQEHRSSPPLLFVHILADTRLLVAQAAPTAGLPCGEIFSTERQICRDAYNCRRMSEKARARDELLDAVLEDERAAVIA